MRKWRALLPLVLCLLLAYGCKEQTQQTLAPESTAPVESTTEPEPLPPAELIYRDEVATLTAKDAKRLFNREEETWKDFSRSPLCFGFSGNRFFLWRENSDEESEKAGDRVFSTKEFYYFYDMASDQLHQLATQPSVFTWMDAVLMQDGLFCYDARIYSDNKLEGDEYGLLFRLEGQSKKMTTVDRVENPSVRFSYFDKLSEEKFIAGTYEVLDINEKGIPGTNIVTLKRYNINDGQGVELLRTESHYLDGEYVEYRNLPGDYSGTSLIHACAMDGKIYATVREYTGVGEESENFIRIYDREGVLEQSIPILPQDGEGLKKLVYGSFTVVGDHWLISNGPEGSAMYRLKDGRLQEVLPVNKNLRFAGGMQNFYRSGDHPYLFFTYANVYGAEEIVDYFFALERETGMVTKIDVSQVDPEYHRLSDITCDTHGNLMLELIRDVDTSYDTRQYYVSADTMAGLLP